MSETTHDRPVRLHPTRRPAPERQAPMPDPVDGPTDITITDRCLYRDGTPWLPITGEMHYSRVPRHRWAETLRLMRAGGITVVATYIFWIHHQPDAEHPPRFDDDLDLAEFVRVAAEVGLDVVLRIGPWCHGEVRNGGLPDWVVAAPYRERTDDPAYLEHVRRWFAQLGEQVSGWCEPGGPVVGIQIENEIYDQPAHISTLKRMARESGLRAPLWTATAWGGADIPVGDVFPMYGGYVDGFWLATHDDWIDHGFSTQFAFTDQWDDPEIGADLAGDSRSGLTSATTDQFPPATCELGGGMASSYHRRIDAHGLDTAAIAHCKIGSGSVWQGYYMYVGGTNPGPELQESHATSYPNDLPRWNYDFAAPIGAHLQLRESFHRLRMQHAFLTAHGHRLARMQSTLLPGAGNERWALRSDEHGGFLYLNTHRPYDPLPAEHAVQFDIELAGQHLRVPREPIDVPSGTIAAWPLLFDLDVITLRWATATVLTTLESDDGDPLLVLTAAPGVPVHLAFPNDHEVLIDGATPAGVLDSDEEIVVSDLPVTSRTFVEVTSPRGRARLLVLSEDEALRTWTPLLEGRQRLAVTDAEGLYEQDGLLRVLTSAPVTVDLLAGDGGAEFESYRIEHDQESLHLTVEQLAEAQEPAPARFGLPDRASAPSDSELEDRSARFRVTISGRARAGERSLLRLDLSGDIARSEFCGRSEDVFWNGTEWDIDITPDRDVTERVVDILIYPLTEHTPARLPERADQVRSRATAPVAVIHSADVLTYRTSTLPSPSL